MLTIIKGDTIYLECNFCEDITNWKIRCEIYDESGNSIKLATADSGGSNDQIEITDASEGEFAIKVAKDITTDFDDSSKIEIEVDTGNTVAGEDEILTVYQDEITFEVQQITWTDPTA